MSRVQPDDVEYDAEDMVRDILHGVGKQPNVTMLAFTATPKPHTLKLFGQVGADGSMEPFHVYSMKQAIEEEFVKDVLENYIEYKTFCQIVKTIADDPKYQQRKAAGKIKRILALHEVNIAQRTEVIVEHFREFVMPQLGGQAKAMVVTSSREEAVRYRLAFGKYIAKMGYEMELKPLVAFTGKVKTLGQEFTETGMNGIAESRLADEFDEDGNNILIVANKYQTGFDQPRLCAMYVLKKLSGVNAVHTRYSGALLKARQRKSISSFSRWIQISMCSANRWTFRKARSARRRFIHGRCSARRSDTAHLQLLLLTTIRPAIPNRARRTLR